MGKDTKNTKLRWRIIFINDFHGHLDGSYDYYHRRRGGLGCISKQIENIRGMDTEYNEFYDDEFIDGSQMKGTILCLGGDMVRKYTHRFLHKDSVCHIWNWMMACLNPNVIVLGNHELKDFGIDFAKHVIKNSGKTGCTRNIYAKEPKCPCIKGDWIPKSSKHKEQFTSGEGDEFLSFVGLVDYIENLNITPYSLDEPKDTIGDVLLPFCFHEEKCAKDKVVIHLAHYDRKVPKDIMDKHKAPDSFGAIWATQLHHLLQTGEDKEERRTPHFILKGHDHSRSPDEMEGVVPLKAKIRTDKAKGIVPTFSVGSDGEAFGILDIVLNEDKELEYKWKTEDIAAKGMVPFELEMPKVKIWNDSKWFKKGISFKPFGRSMHDANLLVRSMDLLLKSLLNVPGHDNTNCIAIASSSSIYPNSKVPSPIEPEWNISLDDMKPYLTEELEKDIAEEERDMPRKFIDLAWNSKIDDWDLWSVFGDKNWRSYEPFITDLNDLTDKITGFLKKPKGHSQPAMMPPFENGSHKIVTDALWLSKGGKMWVIHQNNVNNISVYEINSNGEKFYSRKMELSAENCSLGDVLGIKGDERKICVHTTEFVFEQLFPQNRIPMDQRYIPVNEAVRRLIEDCTTQQGDNNLPRPIIFE